MVGVVVVVVFKSCVKSNSTSRAKGVKKGRVICTRGGRLFT